MTGGGGRAATVAAMVMEMFFVAVCVHYHVKSENDSESTVAASLSSLNLGS
jgi:hypothetical protein